jgi:hypothetical protein
MKLKAIAKVFKSYKTLALYTNPDGGKQWVGGEFARYKLIGLPQLTADQLLTLFDIPEAKRGGCLGKCPRSLQQQQRRGLPHRPRRNRPRQRTNRYNSST